MNLKIIDAKQEDSLEIEKIKKAVWLSTYLNREFNILEEDLNEQFGNENELKIKASKREINVDKLVHYYVAKVDNKNVGVLASKKRDNILELTSLYILVEYQHCGIGKKLVEKLIQDNPNDNIILEVATYNENAINFYKKLGFIETGKKENFKLKSGKNIPVLEMLLKKS